MSGEGFPKIVFEPEDGNDWPGYYLREITPVGDFHQGVQVVERASEEEPLEPIVYRRLIDDYGNIIDYGSGE